MNINNLFFHIHYCNMKQAIEPGKYTYRLSRTLQHHELGFMVGGKGQLAIENRKYPVKDGTLFYIWPNVLHSLEVDAEGPILFLSVHFSYVNVDFNESNWGISNETDILPLPFAQELKDYYQVKDIFKKLADSWYAKLPGYELITKALLQQLIFEIFQNMNKQSQNYAISLNVEKIIEYMRQNINSKVTLKELSELVQLSPAYLSRTFKDITGYSVIEFFNKMKIDKAKELIIEGNRKVKEVAHALGFTDEFYFSRVFKRSEGISPTEFHSKNVHGI